MSSPSKGKILKSIILVVLITALVGGVGYYIHASKERAEKLSNQQTIEKMGVIDYEQLIPIHKDYWRIEEIEKQIKQVGPKPPDPSKIKKVNQQLSKKMLNYQNQLKAMMAQEQARIQSNTRARARAIQARNQAEFKRKKDEFMRYKAQLDKEYGKRKKNPKTEMSAFEKEFAKRLRSRARDLIALKERQIAAKSLELSKRSREKLMSRKKSIDQKVIAYEEQVRKETQNKKLDLQLKLQVAKTAEERSEVQSQLQKLFQEERSKVSSKRKELYADIVAIESKEKKKNGAILRKYKVKLDADVDRQLSGVKRRVANELYKEGMSKGASNPYIPKGYNEKLRAKQKQLQKEMNILQSNMRRQMNALSAQAKREFEGRRRLVISKLKNYQKNLAKEFDKKRNKMIAEIKSSNKKQQEEKKKLIEQRAKMFDSIVKDINKKVEEVAKKKNISVVIGSYVASVDAVNLTDDVKAILENESEKNGIKKKVDNKSTKLQRSSNSSKVKYNRFKGREPKMRFDVKSNKKSLEMPGEMPKIRF